MGLRINQNIAAMNAYRNLSVTDGQMSKALEKLSSGFRINRAADDAAGLSISEGLRSQVNGLKVATRNAQDGISVVQTAEGALGETQNILQRMRDLAVQAANGGAMDANAQSAADTEFQELGTELTRIAGNTKFGSQSLLGGSYAGAFQVGADNTTGSVITVDLSTTGNGVMNSSGTATTKVATITGLDATGLKVDSATLNLKTTSSATSAIDALDLAIKDISTVRGTLGAYQNRFDHTINNLNTAVENLSSSESRIRDTDMAQEMMGLTRSQVLSQAGTAMLAQANQAAQSVMQLLRG